MLVLKLIWIRVFFFFLWINNLDVEMYINVSNLWLRWFEFIFNVC